MQDDIEAKLRSSAKAFRENTVYTADGDAIRLGVQADEAEEAADTIAALRAENERLRVRVAELEIAGHCLAPVLKLAADPRIPRQRCDLSLERPAKTFLAVLGEQL